MKRSLFAGLGLVLAAALAVAALPAAAAPDLAVAAVGLVQSVVSSPESASLALMVPTVGRKVWYTPSAYDKSGPGGIQTVGTPPQPVDATVIAAWNDRCVNLHIVDAQGRTHTRTSVKLLQDDDAPPTDSQGNTLGGYAEWMPYQKGQAAKDAVPEQRTADANTA
jgi:hypothetical protein